MSAALRPVRFCDVTLRDGSHANQHTFAPDDVRAVVSALDAAGVPLVEVCHGDGLGGSSVQYGFSKHDDLALIRAAADAAKRARIAVLVLPGVGTSDDLRRAADAGARAARVRGAAAGERLRAEVRERFDEDWWRNPRTAAHLAALLAAGRLPESDPPPPVRAATGALVERLEGGA